MFGPIRTFGFEWSSGLASSLALATYRSDKTCLRPCGFLVSSLRKRHKSIEYCRRTTVECRTAHLVLPRPSLSETKMEAEDSLRDTARDTSPLDSAHTSRSSQHRSGRAEKGGPDLLQLPKAHVVRIVKSVLPPNVRLNSAAATAFNRCSAVFLLALADASSAACAGKRKTVQPSDVLAGLRSLGFDSIADTIEEKMRSDTDMERKGGAPTILDPAASTSEPPVADEGVNNVEGDANNPVHESPSGNQDRGQDDESSAEEETSSEDEGEGAVEANDAFEAIMEVVDDVLADEGSQVQNAQPDPYLF
ncbi:nf-yb1 protein [Cystoisospora suis]|uniref:Nf-yb1 protein n=1 Tax=Cystoisospora suis TaxID=483139 RepID=A0A2C6KYS0_9APIC|nr:nf-yb1 protein [Cystoisospora suis]